MSAQVVSLTQNLARGIPGQLLGFAVCGGGGRVGSLRPRAPADLAPGLPTQDFDRLLESLRAALAKDAGTGFVFSCLSGQGRTTTAMVVAVLAFWHIQVCVACHVWMGQGGARSGDAGCGRRVWGAETGPGAVLEPLPSVLGRGHVGLAAPPARGSPQREGVAWTEVLPVLAAVLPQGFPEVGEEELVSVPDAKFTKGEFEVSMPQGAPGGCLGEGRGHVSLAVRGSSELLFMMSPSSTSSSPCSPAPISQ